jgi:hypothetical protein
VSDPTYNRDEIAKNPEWQQLAFDLSEIQNDNAPIGWSKYIFVAKCLLGLYEMKRKP